MTRINNLDELDILVDLAFRVAVDVLQKSAELDRSGHEFKTISLPAFVDDRVDYRTVKSGASVERALDLDGAFTNDNRWGTKYQYSELDGFEALINYVIDHDDLKRFHSLAGGRDEFMEHVLRVNVGKLPVIAAEKHVFENGWELNTEALREHVLKLAAWWVLDEVPIRLVVPILNISFESDRIELDEKTFIERMDDGLQLARASGNPRVSAYKELIPMATHAIVLEGWTLPNPTALTWLWTPEDSPIEAPVLDRFFQVLSTFAEEPTGYVQVLYRPVGWSHEFTGPLPEVLPGPFLPHYSTALKAATEPTKTLSGSEIELLREGFTSLGQQENIVSVAAQRLLDAERRPSDVDRLLDLCIGIEALVAGNPGDATYKVAIRIAAVLAELGISNSAEVIEASKSLYSLRSAIVHGRKRPAKAVNVTLHGRQVDTIEAARYFLRNLLRARLQWPELTTDDIDSRIIAGALALWGQAVESTRDQGVETEQVSSSDNTNGPSDS
ncbi:HEPN domain-containing protein [Amycolatopsis sp. EV170708-02-1]|uniref:HEPN domain-containing protein n=1 Tax=Amycolatopsis sp. EV170708-02-1 TaxID=2919322 RepID=UPI001F0C2FA3|nr:HEPN domain-containing protein [Amycolatopsis sp. EV170708-02-1]UMP04386.1 HEPN domain-containing protein [Amycolatopsis sp. EV170708-02-1]